MDSKEERNMKFFGYDKHEESQYDKDLVVVHEFWEQSVWKEHHKK